MSNPDRFTLQMRLETLKDRRECVQENIEDQRYCIKRIIRRLEKAHDDLVNERIHLFYIDQQIRDTQSQLDEKERC